MEQQSIIIELLRKIDSDNKVLREDMNRQFSEVRYDLRLDKEKLEKVYESRDRVTVQFTRSWAMASFFMALIACTVVLSVAKAF